MTSPSYFFASVSIDDAHLTSHGASVSGAVTLIPARVDRTGFMIQNNGAFDVWFKYGAGVTVGGVGSFCLPANANAMFVPPPNGVFRGDITAIADGGASNVSAYEWFQL